jgi:hypothetical protein
VRLAFYHRIKETLPESFWGLLGPEPRVGDMPAAVREAMFPAPPQHHLRQQQQRQQGMKALPAPPPPKARGDQEMAAAQQQEEGDGKQQEEGAAEGQQAEEGAQGADVEMAEQQEAAAAEAGGGAAEAEQEAAAAEEAAAEAPAEPEPPSREDVLVAELVVRIRSKQTPSELEAWLQQECGPGADMDEGGNSEEALRVAAVRVMARGVLLAGCKSWEHSSRIMQR